MLKFQDFVIKSFQEEVLKMLVSKNIYLFCRTKEIVSIKYVVNLQFLRQTLRAKSLLKYFDFESPGQAFVDSSN